LFYVESLNEEAANLERAHYSDADVYPGMGASAPAAALARIRLIEEQARRGTLLDVGAGKGEFVSAASAAGWDATGLEPSAGLARHAAESGARVRQGYADGTHPAAPGGFDVITLIHVLEHVETPVELLQSLRTQLKPDGMIFVEVPNCDSYFLRFVEAYYRARRLDWSPRLSPFHPPFHRIGYTSRSLRFALSACGYMVVDSGTFAGFDRDCGLGGSTGPVERLARRVLSQGLDLLGNRELLYAMASPQRPIRPG
jgi:SAM-dependent methyltransferase